MTMTTPRQKSRKGGAADAGAPQVPVTGLVPGSFLAPQVNLLPPEVHAARSLRSTKRLLALVLTAVTVASAGGAVLAYAQADQAADALAREQAETRRLLAAQQQYAEVPVVLGALERARQAQVLGTSSEVLWTPFLTQLMLTAPPDVVFTQVVIMGATPMQPAPLPAHPLEPEAQYRLTFSGRAVTLPDTAAWMEALDGIEAFESPYVTSLSMGRGTGSWAETDSFEVTGSVLITGEALANRFAPTTPTEGD